LAWLLMAAALVTIGMVGDAGEGTVGRSIAYAAAVVFLAGMLTTLYGNLRHPMQWLVAGAGVAGLVGSAFLPAGSDAAKLLGVVGLLVFLFGPRLIGSRLRARAARQGQ
jgi:hypothetical protein